MLFNTAEERNKPLVNGWVGAQNTRAKCQSFIPGQRHERWTLNNLGAIYLIEPACTFSGSSSEPAATAVPPVLVVYVRYKLYRVRCSAARYVHTTRLQQKGSIRAIERTDMSTIDFGCQLTTCKCQELHAPGKQSGPRMHAQRTERERRACILLRFVGNTGKSFAHHTS